MKWSVVLIVSLILQSGTGLAEQTGWNTFGPIGGTVGGLAIDPVNPNTLYASASGALFKSTDKGANWRVLNSSVAPGTVGALVVDPHDSRNIYASSGWEVFKSSDGGTSWAVLHMSSSWLDIGYWGITLDPKNPGVVYANSADEDNGSGGLLKSSDGGATWRRLPLPNELAWGASYVLSVTIDPQNRDVVYAGTYSNLYQSMDGGATWRRIAGASTLAIDPENSSTLYLGTLGGLFKSTDRGSSWSPDSLLPAHQVSRLEIDAHDPATLYASVVETQGFNSFKSKDRGVSWTRMSGSLPDVIPAAWDPQNPDIIYYSISGELFRSTDAGTSWRRLYSGLATMNVTAVLVDKGNPGSVYAFTSNRVFKSVDGGRRWNALSSVTGLTPAVAMDPQNPRTIYANGNGGLFKSLDGAVTWQLVSTELARFSTLLKLEIDARNPATLYALAYGGFYGNTLFRSNNGGVNWSPVNVTVSPSSISAFAMNPHDSQNLYVGALTGSTTVGSGLYRSSDGGNTWTNISFPSPGGNSVSTIAFDPHDSEKVYVVLNCGRVFKSTDRGATFTLTTASPTFVPSCIRALHLDPKNSNSIYAATYAGVLRSTDGGVSWIAESSVPQTFVRDLAIDGTANKVCAAVSRSGVFATFDSVEPTPVPTLTLDSAEYCIGQSWTLKVSGGQPGTAIRLLGFSNAHSWEIEAWNRTDADGSYGERGVFSLTTKGRHMLYVEIDGASSNDVSFHVSDCSP